MTHVTNATTFEHATDADIVLWYETLSTALTVCALRPLSKTREGVDGAAAIERLMAVIGDEGERRNLCLCGERGCPEREAKPSTTERETVWVDGECPNCGSEENPDSRP